jgi:hypothetical protein
MGAAGADTVLRETPLNPHHESVLEWQQFYTERLSINGGGAQGRVLRGTTAGKKRSIRRPRFAVSRQSWQSERKAFWTRLFTPTVNEAPGSMDVQLSNTSLGSGLMHLK